jgi:hypothetical protein
MSARLVQMQQVLEEAESRAVHANEPIPKVTLGILYGSTLTPQFHIRSTTVFSPDLS